MVTTRRDYSAEGIEAAKSVLIELVQLLGEFRDQMVVIGGWVPVLLLTDAREPHVGTLDIDLALDFRNIPEASYKTLLSYPGGAARIAAEFHAHLGHGLVRKGLAKMRNAFLSPDHAGPRWLADFLDVMDAEERAILRRRAYEEVTAWLDALGIEPWRA